jgi:hypothetical protein
MQFVCVDRIHLLYCYGTDIVKSPSTSYSADTYIDQRSCKFYILKKYETSEMRYIDAMAEFIVEDEVGRSKLSVYIKKLLQMYQNNVEQGLNQLRENLTQNDEPKWIIPEAIKKNVLISSSIQTVHEKPVITNEKIEQLMSEPSRRQKPRPKEVADEKDPKGITSFPLRAGVSESHEIPATNNSSKPQMKTKLDDSTEGEHRVSELNGENPRVSTDREQENNEHVVPKSKNNKQTYGNI